MFLDHSRCRNSVRVLVGVPSLGNKINNRAVLNADSPDDTQFVFRGQIKWVPVVCEAQVRYPYQLIQPRVQRLLYVAQSIPACPAVLRPFEILLCPRRISKGRAEPRPSNRTPIRLGLAFLEHPERQPHYSYRLRTMRLV